MLDVMMRGLTVEGQQRKQVVDVVNPALIAGRCAGGVVLASSPLGMHRSNLRYQLLNRFVQPFPNVLVSSSGDYSDFQQLRLRLIAKSHKAKVYDRTKRGDAQEVASTLAQTCYERRNKGDPYLIEGVVAGVDTDGSSQLFYIDKFGNLIEMDYICTGFALMICPPYIDKVKKEKMTFQEVRDMLVVCFKTLNARNVVALEEVDFAYLTKDGAKFETEKIRIKWDYEINLKKEQFMSTK